MKIVFNKKLEKLKIKQKSASHPSVKESFTHFLHCKKKICSVGFRKQCTNSTLHKKITETL